MGSHQITWLLLAALLGLTAAIEVNFTGEYQAGLGWQLTCAWTISAEERLNSVKMYTNNSRLFFFYSPELESTTRTFGLGGALTTVHCVQNVATDDGHCNITIEPTKSPTADQTLSCHVLGGRPWFRDQKQDYILKAFVPPSDAELVTSVSKESPSTTTFNCSSTGLPAPNLVWTVAGETVSADYTGRIWNPTTKLWDVWSVISATAPLGNPVKVVCTPEIDTTKGKPAENILEGAADTAPLEVSVTGHWVAEVGWKVTCSWKVSAPDRLAVVHLYNKKDNNRNKDLLVAYWPKNKVLYVSTGPETLQGHNIRRNRQDEAVLKADCMQIDNTEVGHCNITLKNPIQPTTDSTISCQITGDSPEFRDKKADYILRAYVPPSNAELVMSRSKESVSTAIFNCSSTGQPAPHLAWAVGDQNVNEDFTGRLWNPTTKLWQAWSVITVSAPYDESVKVVCTPEINNNKGLPAERIFERPASLSVLREAVEVRVTGDWVPELGWQVTCTWKIPAPDRLQSVRLYDNNQQFMFYRPETNGPTKSQFFRRKGDLMRVDCWQNILNTDTGKCTISIEPFKPPATDSTFSCEVSGERPWFLQRKQDYILRAFVPPSDAEVIVSRSNDAPYRATFNCSSSGLPAPNLVWTIADHNVIGDFTGRVWNSTSKLWQAWSYLAATAPLDASVRVVCTPETNHTRGQPAAYTLQSAASASVINKIMLCTLTLLSLAR